MSSLRRQKTMKQTVLSLLLATMVFYACTPPTPPADSQPQTGSVTKGLSVNPPPRRPPEVISRFKRNMKTKLSPPTHKPEFTNFDKKQRREIVRSALLEQLGLEGGIPYYQLLDALDEVFDLYKWQCAGSSCGTSYELRPNEIPSFLAATRNMIAGDPLMAQSTPNLREQLLGSLTEFSTLPKPLDMMLAELPLKKVMETEKPVAPLASEVLTRLLSAEERHYIKLFTIDTSKNVRLSQIKTVDELMNEGYSRDDALTVRAQGQAFDKTLAKLPKSSGTIYRGVRNISRPHIADIFLFYQQKSLVTLGQDNLPAVSSASRALSVAQDYSSHNCNLNIVYIIKQHSGVSIEAISAHPQEQEVLIPTSAVFQISGLYKADHNPSQIYVELVEYPRMRASTSLSYGARK